MAIGGLRGTGDFGADERPKSFREGILKMTPNGTAPIFSLSSKAGKKSVPDPEFKWWNETETIVRLQLNGAVDASGTLFTVDSPDPTATTLGAVYGKASHLKPGDILLVEPTTDAASYAVEHIRVTNVLSDTQFTAERGIAGTTGAIAAIADDRWLTLIGSAYAEGTAAPKATQRGPVQFWNYCQIFKDAYEITGTLNETELRTGDAWSQDKKRKAFDHARAIEWSILFGKRFETVGTNGKPLRTMGGFRDILPASRQFYLGVGWTFNGLLDTISPLFDYDSGAGNTRMVFAGNAAILSMSIKANAVSGVQMSPGPAVKVYGYDFREFIVPRGRLLLYSHPLMSQHPLYKNSAIVVDFDSFKYVHLRNRDTKPHDDVQTKDEDVRRGYFLTECSMAIDRGGLTQAYIGGILPTP